MGRGQTERKCPMCGKRYTFDNWMSRQRPVNAPFKLPKETWNDGWDIHTVSCWRERHGQKKCRNCRGTGYLETWPRSKCGICGGAGEVKLDGSMIALTDDQRYTMARRVGLV